MEGCPGLIPFQTNMTLFPSLSKMQHSLWERTSCLNGFLSATSFVFIEPVALETQKVEGQSKISVCLLNCLHNVTFISRNSLKSRMLVHIYHIERCHILVPPVSGHIIFACRWELRLGSKHLLIQIQIDLNPSQQLNQQDNCHKYSSMLSEKKVEKKAHGNDFFRLGAFIDHLQFTTATLLAVSDRNGHFGGFQALKGITFTARPVVNDLGFHRGEQKETMTQIM